MSSNSSSNSNTSRILIVDDEEINLELFEVMLSRLGFEVEMASDGEQALAMLPDVKPDLIVLDNIMPGLTGWEVTRRIKNAPEFAAYRQVPIVMFTAMDEIADRIEGLELGVDDYITKPFNFSEVLARIRAVLHRHELAGQFGAPRAPAGDHRGTQRVADLLLAACPRSRSRTR